MNDIQILICHKHHIDAKTLSQIAGVTLRSAQNWLSNTKPMPQRIKNYLKNQIHHDIADIVRINKAIIPENSLVRLFTNNADIDNYNQMQENMMHCSYLFYSRILSDVIRETDSTPTTCDGDTVLCLAVPRSAFNI